MKMIVWRWLYEDDGIKMIVWRWRWRWLYEDEDEDDCMKMMMYEDEHDCMTMEMIV